MGSTQHREAHWSEDEVPEDEDGCPTCVLTRAMFPSVSHERGGGRINIPRWGQVSVTSFTGDEEAPADH